MTIKQLAIAVSAVLLAACGGEKASEKEEKTDSSPKDTATVVQENITDEAVPLTRIVDPHSAANINQVATKHIHLDLEVDFENKKLKGTSTIDIINKTNGEKFIIDSKGLVIEKILLDGEKETTYKVISTDELLGDGISIDIEKTTKQVVVYYETTDASEALQWLNPSQTKGKVHPYLFTQGQAILTRTWVPCQDTPSLRITYSANIKCPSDLMAVMSANNPTEKNATGEYSFEMKQSIPCYLMALAVGDLTFEAIGEHTGVYTEPGMMKIAANELVDMEDMLVAAEGLYGEYKWERYDVIVLPPSFPFGGMENPRLTFATPTILAGDRSLVSLIAHELAHSWSGNLVTNANWDDFWLNEGFTVYFENRIMEEIYGKDYAEMLMMLSEQDLKAEIADMKANGKAEDTYLKLKLAGRSPDDGMTSIAYDKGGFFLKMLEKNTGREKFDAFLKDYFTAHQFQTMTTEDFVAYLEHNLIEKYNLKINAREWIFGEGLPASHVQINSNKFKLVDESLAKFYSGTPAKDIVNKEWKYQQTLHLIRNIKEETTLEQMAELDAAFGLTNSGNSEIACAWFEKSVNHNYKAAYPKMEEFLINVGRRKFLTPLYKALCVTDEGLKIAKDIYAKARPNYHAVSTGTMDALLHYKVN